MSRPPFRDLCILSLCDSLTFDVRCVRAAIHKRPTDFTTLAEIISTRNVDEILDLKSQYEVECGQKLVEVLQSIKTDNKKVCIKIYLYCLFASDIFIILCFNNIVKLETFMVINVCTFLLLCYPW